MTALLLTAALAIGQGRITNGQLETKAATQSLEREIAAATSRGGARWIGYRIHIANGRRSMDCFDRGRVALESAADVSLLARFEGNTLVVETTNFSDRSNFRGAGAHLRLTERFTRTDPETIEYRFTVEDPTTWSRPWTVTFPMLKNDEPMFEYACHEGNYGLKNILGNARVAEKTERREK